MGLLKQTVEKSLAVVNYGIHLGTEVEKGMVLTDEYLIKHENEIRDMCDIFVAYPDIFLDVIKPSDEDFTLFFYQRITLRALMRYKSVYVTAPRAFSKSFITILGMFLQCVFFPRTKRFICAPAKNQSAQIAKEKLAEIFQHWPLLKKEVIGGDIQDMPGNYGKDYVNLKFRNGSVLDVVGAADTTRGGRRHGGLLDELRDHDETAINEIVLPLLNVSRRLPDNTVNDKEVNQQVISMTSAGVKTSFAYEKLIDDFENAIIDPTSTFVFGCDYRVPCMHGLLDKKFINKLRMSPSYNENSFAREYLGLWSGTSDEAWFKYDKISKYRKIKNPEKQASSRLTSEQFYLLSVDVGRISDQTVVTVFRVGLHGNKYYCTVVNIFVLGREMKTKTFVKQAIDLKRIIKNFNPKEVVIDTNGLGVGLADEMIRVQIDENGEKYPAYGFINDDVYKKVQPKDSICILYGIKASGSLNSQIHSNVYARLSGGFVKFLITEQEAKNYIMSTVKGQKMTPQQRAIRLIPHEMTTKLFDEMSNLRLKKLNNTDIVLERINERYPKDKYSSFAYGLWRIKELEEKNYKKHTRKSGGVRRLIFFTGGE